MINQITEIITVADQIAMNLYGRERGTLKADGTWVTRADRHIETFLRDEFHALFDAHIFGEEGGWTGDKSAQYCVIIDPIEGTGPFRDQIPLWGISVAMFREGKPWLGVFSMPAAGHRFLGEIGKGTEWNGESITTPATPITRSAYLGVSSDAHQWDLAQYPGKIRGFGVSGVSHHSGRYGRASGRAVDTLPLLRYCYWRHHPLGGGWKSILSLWTACVSNRHNRVTRTSGTRVGMPPRSF